MRPSSVALVALLVGACAAHAGAPATSAAPAPVAPVAASPGAALAAAKPLLGDWKRADGAESHYSFAGDAIFGVTFTGGEGFEVSITTAEPDLKTRTWKDGASEVASDGAPSSEGLTRVESASAPAIEQSDRDFAEASRARGAAGWAEWFDAKGAQWDGGENGAPGKRIEGPAAVKEYMTPVFARPGFRLEWTPERSAVAPGGAIGYSVGSWQGVFIGEGGARTIRSHGGFVTVWKRQGDGSWKVLFDTGDPAS